MNNYILLLTDNILSLVENNGFLPDEFMQHSDSIHGFNDVNDAMYFIAQKLCFDDIYAFGAEYGIDYLGKKVYYRNPKD